ncbi:MAG: tetratricopeptide repeat protein [Gemmatimonadota bacterium]|nr:tetratricopeptide repeat protein [Gemmatimonadota bacterium]
MTDKKNNLSRLCLVLVLLGTVLIYARTFDYGTVNWDDRLSRKYEQTGTRLGLDRLAGIITPSIQGTYQPVRELTSVLLARTSSPGTWWPYHLVSIALYLGTVLLFYLTLRLLFRRLGLTGEKGGGEWGALLGTAFFAFHPAHVEVVAWTLGQKDTLVGFFYLGSFYFYARPEGFVRRRDLIVSLVFYFLALGSKPSAVSLALVLPIYDRLFRPFLFERTHRLKLIAAYLLYFLPAAAGALLISLSTTRLSLGAEPVEWIVKVAGAISFSAAKLLYPVNLCLRYPAFGYGGHDALRGFLLLAAAALIVFFTFRAWFKHKPWVFFACWALVALLPNMNLVPIRIERADRYFYLASIGFSALAGYAGLYLYCVAGRIAKTILRPLFLTVLLCLGVISCHQAGFWRDGPAAWNRVLALYPDLIIARVALGHSYVQQGGNERALEVYRPLLERSPPNVEALMGAAQVLHARGDTDGSLRLLRMAHSLSPTDYDLVEMLARQLIVRGDLFEAQPLARGWVSAEPSNSRARLLETEISLRLGDPASAAAVLDSLLESDPGNLGAECLRARMFLTRGEVDQAERLLLGLVEKNPGFRDAWMLLARLYGSTVRDRQAEDIYSCYSLLELDQAGLEFMGARHLARGDLDRALEKFLELLRRRPRMARGYNNAAVVYERMERYTCADSLYRKAIELDSAYVDAFYNRGNLLRLTGRPLEALDLYRRADSLAGGTDRAVIEKLADTFAETGDRRSARRCLERLKKLKPQGMDK